MPAQFGHCVPKTFLPNNRGLPLVRKKSVSGEKGLFPRHFLRHCNTEQAAYFGRTSGQKSPRFHNKLARPVLQPFAHGLQGSGGGR